MQQTTRLYRHNILYTLTHVCYSAYSRICTLIYIILYALAYYALINTCLSSYVLYMHILYTNILYTCAYIYTGSTEKLKR